MLRTQIYEDVKAAMKAQDAATLDVVRFLWSEIKRVEIDAKHELTDEEVIELLRREIKKRNEAIEQMKAGGREDMAAHEQAQLGIVQKYVPALMSKEQVAEVVARVLESGISDFGPVMGKVMSELKGKADGKMVQEVVKEKLG